ncbi:uncharacterized protein LOC108864181, partial [Galendromus occidentalis]|uniref:Uncharacterized protein LOC108864181 n=1 Tax=Galendromus occidentalis TaxID=34638 RepID=A0AAJ7PA37_9ACAR
MLKGWGIWRRPGALVKDIIAAYSPNDVFNADESGLFYQSLPERSLTAKSDPCKGGKKSKLRLTALFCCNASGTEKRKILIVGKSNKPRCLRNVKSTLCHYRGNRNAWMTRDPFSEWLARFGRDMGSENRRVLLLIDNCSAHMALSHLTHVRVENFPPNCTSVIQPLDLGIIRAAKANYRKALVRQILVDLETGNESKIDVRAAMDMTAHSWSEIESTSIQNCWMKSGLFGLRSPSEEEEFLDIDSWRIDKDSLHLPERFSFDQFVTYDDGLEVCEAVTESSIIRQVSKAVEAAPDRERDSSSAEDDDGAENEPPSLKTTIQALQTIKSYLSHRENVPDHIIANALCLEAYIIRSQARNRMQMKVTDFCYRCINLTSHLYKTFTGVLADRVTTQCLPQISENQHGFLPHRSCEEALQGLIEFVESNREPTLAVFVDFRAAFDNVNRKKLLETVGNEFKSRGKLLNAIRAIMWPNNLIVDNGADLGKPVKQRKGVQQGKSISPLLFVMFLNSLLERLERRKVFVKMFADDLVIAGVDIDEVQISLSVLCICFKYLGITMQPALSFSEHIEQLLTRTATTMACLGNVRRLPLELAIKIFNINIVPTITYGMTCISQRLSKTALLKLDKCKTLYLKSALGPRAFSNIILETSGKNYIPWKTVMPAVIGAEPYAWEVVLGTLNPPAEDKANTKEGRQQQKNFDAGNRAAKYILMNSIHPNLATILFLDDPEEVEAHEIWRRIKAKFTSSSGTKKSLAISRFSRFKFTPGLSIEENILAFKRIMYQLNQAGVEVTEDIQCDKILEALPSSWDSFRRAWSARMDTKVTADALLDLIEGEGERLERDESRNVTALMSRLNMSNANRNHH